MAWRGLTKQLWEAIRVYLPQPKVSRQGGRLRVEDRRCFEGIFWILWTRAQWSELPAGMAIRAHAGGDSSSGKRLAFCSSSGEPSWPS